MIELEDAVMEIIVNAGQSRSLCFEALHAARTGNIDEARLLLNEADGYARRAHQMQTQLIGQDAGEARQPMTLIMVHAGSFDEFAAGPRVLRRINPSVPALINME
jgi:PTS system cellobiose-specific IIA component